MPLINWKIDFGHILLVILTFSGFLISWGQYSNSLEAAVVQMKELREDVKVLNKEVNAFHSEHMMLMQKVNDLESQNNQEHLAIIKNERH